MTRNHCKYGFDRSKSDVQLFSKSCLLCISTVYLFLDTSWRRCILHNVIFLVNGFLALIKMSTFGRKKIAFLGLRNLTFCRDWEVAAAVWEAYTAKTPTKITARRCYAKSKDVDSGLKDVFCQTKSIRTLDGKQPVSRPKRWTVFMRSSAGMFTFNWIPQNSPA